MNEVLPLFIPGCNGLAEVLVPQGGDIRQAVTEFVLQKKWRNVYVAGAIGSVIQLTLTAPCRNELPLRCQSVVVSDAAEIIQLCGEIMPRQYMDPDLAEVYPDKESPLFVHLHAACAVAGGKVLGGGLRAGKAFRALRIFLCHLDDSGYL